MSASSLAEIASLFQDSLNDLTTNDRLQIQILTVIAKEHIEAAQEISRTLESHIRTTAPSRKLPALYVLDSIAKNVGSPYTIYLGRNLYSTFMDAYTLVDNPVRRAMESMLRTWQKPPTSADPTPVFPFETTTSIDAALNKARAILQRNQPPMMYRNTPPPPMYSQNGYRATPLSYPQQGYPPPSTPEVTQSLLASLNRPRPQDDLYQLQEDIRNLITNCQQDFARNVYDVTIQQRLKALLDLQNVVQTQQLPPDAIAAIKSQVATLSTAIPRLSSATPVPTWQPPSAPPPQQTSTTSQPAFPAGALEALLAAAGKPGTPTLPPAMPSFAPPSAPQLPSLPPGTNLFDALRAAGLTSSLPTPPPPPLLVSGAPPSMASAADLLRSLQGIPALANLKAQPATRKKTTMPTSADLKVFRPDLVKRLYEELPTQCSTCGRRFPGTEGGRAQKSAHLDWHFRTNQRIADANNGGAATYRKFYLNEMSWISLPNFDPSAGLSGENDGVVDVGGGGGGGGDGYNANTDGTGNGSMVSLGNGNGSGNGYGLVGMIGHGGDQQQQQQQQQQQRRVAERWIPIPAPGSVAGNAKTCPICQDAFETVWLDGAQEWVWMDAEWVGDVVRHATCHEEVTKSSKSLSSAAGLVPAASVVAGAGAGAGAGSAASKDEPPDSGAGKRKADDMLASLRAKLTKGSTA